MTSVRTPRLRAATDPPMVRYDWLALPPVGIEILLNTSRRIPIDSRLSYELSSASSADIEIDSLITVTILHHKSGAVYLASSDPITITSSDGDRMEVSDVPVRYPPGASVEIDEWNSFIIKGGMKQSIKELLKRSRESADPPPTVATTPNRRLTPRKRRKKVEFISPFKL